MTRTKRHPSTVQLISQENREHVKFLAELKRLADQVLATPIPAQTATSMYADVDDIYAAVVRDLGIIPDAPVDTVAA